MTRLFALLTALTLGLAAPVAAPARAETQQERAALDVAGSLVEMAHGALADPALDAAAKFDSLSYAVNQSFAFDVWERFLLGDRADSFSEPQIAEFRALLPRFLARLYANQFGKGLDRVPEIREARTVRGDVLVRAQIPRAGDANLPVDWRIREIEGKGARVIDVMVGGTSFLILKREEFGALLDKGGPTALLDFMNGFVAEG